MAGGFSQDYVTLFGLYYLWEYSSFIQIKQEKSFSISLQQALASVKTIFKTIYNLFNSLNTQTSTLTLKSPIEKFFYISAKHLQLKDLSLDDPLFKLFLLSNHSRRIFFQRVYKQWITSVGSKVIWAQNMQMWVIFGVIWIHSQTWIEQNSVSWVKRAVSFLLFSKLFWW